MQEMITLSIQLHIFFIYASLVMMGLFLYALKANKKASIFSFSLYTTLIQSSLFFTGIIVMAVYQFQLSYIVWGMVPLWLFLIVAQAKRALMLRQLNHGEITLEQISQRLSQTLIRDIVILALFTLLFSVVK